MTSMLWACSIGIEIGSVEQGHLETDMGLKAGNGAFNNKIC